MSTSFLDQHAEAKAQQEASLREQETLRSRLQLSESQREALEGQLQSALAQGGPLGRGLGLPLKLRGFQSGLPLEVQGLGGPSRDPQQCNSRGAHMGANSAKQPCKELLTAWGPWGVCLGWSDARGELERGRPERRQSRAFQARLRQAGCG